MVVYREIEVGFLIYLLVQVVRASMKFFKPNAKIVKWLIEYAAGRLIIDVGCGAGQLLLALRKAGYHKILGIDALADCKQISKFSKLGIQIVPAMAERFNLVRDKGHLLVIARPCHGGFTENVLRANGGNEVLYIGLPTNIESDIPPDFEAQKLPIPSAMYAEATTYRLLSARTKAIRI